MATHAELTAKLAALPEDVRMRIIESLVPRMPGNYVPHTPHPTQQAFLNVKAREAMFGGAASGGKSDALLMAALQYVDIPGYAALILRRTYADLTLPGAIMDRANAWLTGTDAKKKDGGVTWIFPSGARLTFGYLQRESDRYRYQGAEFQFVGMDELTQFPSEDMYTYLFSRLRKPQLSCVVCDHRIRPNIPGSNKGGSLGYVHDVSSRTQTAMCDEAVPDFAMIGEYTASTWDQKTTLFDVPLRMRSATNPGGTGGEWVRRRFVDPKTRTKEAIFVPSFIKDNPSVNTEEYVKSLDYLHPVERERLLEGSWEAMEAGEFFRREWFNYDANPPTDGNTVRRWDMAATAGGGDWTVGALVSEKAGRYYIHDIVRGQWSPGDSERIVAQTAESDGVGIHIRMEQEGGSAGKTVIAHYQRLLSGYSFRGIPSTGSKEARATPLAVAAQKGLVYLKPAEWNRQFLDELTVFPKGAHDDVVDAVSGGFNDIAGRRKSRILV